MKRMSWSLAVLWMTLATSASAQNKFHLKEISILSGKSALGSGLEGSVILENRTHELEAMVAQEQWWLSYSWKFKGTQLFASGGAYERTLWAGPKLQLEPLKFKLGGHEAALGTQQWLGYSTRPHHEPEAKPGFFRMYSGFYVQVGSFTVSYAFLKLRHEEWNQLPGVAVRTPLLKQLHGFAALEYDRHHQHTLFRAALSFHPTHHAEVVH